jgi:alginate O-acetyltransferase complex protein AlgJ
LIVSDKIFISTFFGLLAAGFVGTLLVLGQILPAPTSAPPDARAPAFTNAFIGRDALLTVYQGVRRDVFGAMPPSVVKGKQDWLYYRSEAASDGHSLDDFMGHLQPNAATLAAWQRTIVARRARLAETGIRYLPVVAPDAVSIYPDHLPEEIRRRHGGTRLDAVMAQMPGDILDLRSALRRQREAEDVYDMNDTHWNDVGAFVAYQDITQTLRDWFPGLTPIDRSAMRVRTVMRGREVDFMISARLPMRLRPSAYFDPIRPFAARCSDTGAPVLAPGATRDPKWNDLLPRNWVWSDSECPSKRFIQDAPDLPKAVVFHDSYMISLNPFLSQNFREVLYVRARFDRSVVDREAPDVVIDEIAERHLDALFRE